jgi:glutamate--cysteine ligase
MAKLAERLMDIAEGGLARRKIQRADGQDERVHLARLKDLVAHGSCPADELLAKVPAGPGFEQRVLAAVDLASV